MHRRGVWSFRGSQRKPARGGSLGSVSLHSRRIDSFRRRRRRAMGRAPCCDKATVKRGPWSPEEDAVLKNHIDKFGTGGNWIALPHKAGLNRCGKSCRLRWLNYLRPDIKHGGFTDEEDDIICRLYHKLGRRWSVIASHLRGRTDNHVKNHWNTKLKKKLMTREPNPSAANHSPPATQLPPLLKAESILGLRAQDYCSQPWPVFSVSSSEEDSAASSSTVTGNWSAAGEPGEEDDILFSELDLGFLSELLDGNGSEEKPGEAFPPPLFWASSGTV